MLEQVEQQLVEVVVEDLQQLVVAVVVEVVVLQIP
jgi:hypothetical protein